MQCVTEGNFTVTDLLVLEGLWVPVDQAGMYQRDLEDLEDPYPLEDLDDLEDRAHPDLKRHFTETCPFLTLRFRPSPLRL